MRRLKRGRADSGRTRVRQDRVLSRDKPNASSTRVRGTMFAFTFSSGREEEEGAIRVLLRALVTFVPLFFSLLNMGEFSVIGGIGLLALGACLLLTLRAVAGTP